MDNKMAEELLRKRNEFVVKHNKMNINVLGLLPKETTLRYLHNLTAQETAIVTLIYYDGPKQISEIAGYLRINVPNATRLSNSLVEKDLCQKLNGFNKRAVVLDLTEKGREAYLNDFRGMAQLLMNCCNSRISLSEQKEYLRIYERLTELTSRMLLKDG